MPYINYTTYTRDEDLKLKLKAYSSRMDEAIIANQWELESTELHIKGLWQTLTEVKEQRIKQSNIVWVRDRPEQLQACL